MSYALVKPLALIATGLITAGAIEQGFRKGPQVGNTKLAEFDAKVFMNTTKMTSDDALIDGFGSKIRDMFHLDTGMMSSATKGYYGVKGVFSALADRAIPLGIALASLFTGGIIGAVGLGALAVWGTASAIKSSGLVNDKGSNVLDIRM